MHVHILNDVIMAQKDVQQNFKGRENVIIWGTSPPRGLN